ncbi:MAG: flagellar basal body-associated FliL family protein [Burkholderiaceae bacterium]
MSAAAPEEVVEAPAKKSKKKLIIMVASAVLLCSAGAGAFLYTKNKAAAQAAAAAAANGDDEDADSSAEEHAAAAPGATPTYVPLDAFVVNLTDKDADRFAQIGITLQVDDSKVADQMKTFMPAVRNGILMILAHKSSEELLERSGKEILASEILVAVARALGIAVGDAPAKTAPAQPEQDGAQGTAPADKPDPKSTPKKAKRGAHNPVTRVHFSNFIIQ